MPMKEDSGGSRPVPDPTTLTTQNLEREVSVIKEAMAAQKELLFTRIIGLEAAIAVMRESSTAFPTRIDEKIDAISGVHDERFKSVDKQFTERDIRADQTARDRKTSVDAALQASRDAVAKSESATVKQMDQLAVLIHTSSKGADDQIADLKERLTRIEGGAIGRDSQRTASQSSGQYVLAIAGFVLGALLGLAGLLLTLFLNK